MLGTVLPGLNCHNYRGPLALVGQPDETGNSLSSLTGLVLPCLIKLHIGSTVETCGTLILLAISRVKVSCYLVSIASLTLHYKASILT